MNIVYTRMPGYDFVSVPSDAVIREMEKAGHKIYWLDSVEFLPTDPIDFIFSPYESVTLLGEATSQLLEVPHYAHIEWLPPWRIFKDINPTDYGFTKNSAELKDINSMQTHYKQVGDAWLRADMRSLCAEAMIPFHSTFLGTLKTKIRFPSIDYDTLLKAKVMYPKISKVKNRVLTVARCTPNKRYDLMIRAMNKVQTVGVTWRIVGDGPLAKDIPNLVTNDNVKVELVGTKWGWDRIWEQMEAPVSLLSFTGMPPLEGAFFDNYPVIYRPPNTKEVDMAQWQNEMYGNYIDYAETDVEVASNIDEMLASKDRAKFCINITAACINNQMGVSSSKDNAAQIVARMETHLKEKK